MTGLLYNSAHDDKLVLTVEKESESLFAVKVISWEEGHVWVIRSHRLFSLVEENDDACGFACCFLSTPVLLSLTQALSTDLQKHASTRNTIHFCALNRAHFRKFYTYVSRIVVDKPDTRRFSNSKLKPRDFIVFAYFWMFIHVSDNCLP